MSDLENLIRELKIKVATTSTETLKIYYEFLSKGDIPPSLSKFSNLPIEVIRTIIYEELKRRGVVIKKVRIE